MKWNKKKKYRWPNFFICLIPPSHCHPHGSLFQPTRSLLLLSCHYHCCCCPVIIIVVILSLLLSSFLLLSLFLIMSWWWSSSSLLLSWLGPLLLSIPTCCLPLGSSFLSHCVQFPPCKQCWNSKADFVLNSWIPATPPSSRTHWLVMNLSFMPQVCTAVVLLFLLHFCTWLIFYCSRWELLTFVQLFLAYLVYLPFRRVTSPQSFGYSQTLRWDSLPTIMPTLYSP